MRMDMPNQQTIHHFDVIIVGSGGAGLSLALSLPSHFNIAVLAKAALTEASTFYAQGGVAAVLCLLYTSQPSSMNCVSKSLMLHCTR
ncbi:L-aspartate oxidase [Acinetobacter baumannii]|nr:L-aspartate oxidase [Acinetobacter baumannii]